MAASAVASTMAAVTVAAELLGGATVTHADDEPGTGAGKDIGNDESRETNAGTVAVFGDAVAVKEDGTYVDHGAGVGNGDGVSWLSTGREGAVCNGVCCRSAGRDGAVRRGGGGRGGRGGLRLARGGGRGRRSGGGGGGGGDGDGSGGGSGSGSCGKIVTGG